MPKDRHPIQPGKRGSANKVNPARVGNAENIRPFSTGISVKNANDRCSDCAWNFMNGEWRLKFVSRNCKSHRGAK
jgi:hypothetical protein